jgi:protein phosphatase
MRLQIQSVSHVGYKRDRNEDFVFTGIRTLRDNEAVHELAVDPDTPLFFAVADGLGGAAAGEVASEVAVQVFREGLSSLNPDSSPLDIERTFRALTKKTQETLQRMGYKDPSLSGLGTTLTGVLFLRGSWYWVHVGDTRLYRFRDSTLTQVSRDHTLRELSGDRRIPPNILANCFGGGSEEVYCDVGVLPSVQAQRDALLLTSDGLHDYVPHHRLEELLVQHPENPVPHLLKAGLDMGGVDNISCLYIRVLE